MKTEKFVIEKAKAGAKVVTRDGRAVRIVCYDAPTKNPIYGFIEGDDGITSWREDGRFSNLIDNVDLFFADEEEELTEFEKEVAESYEWAKTTEREDFVKEFAPKLLDLARKELEKDNVIIDKDKYLEICDQYYNNGKKNALKDLPKWEKATEDKDFDRHVLLLEDDRVVIASCVYKDEYYIELNDLKTLPKEE